MSTFKHNQRYLVAWFIHKDAKNIPGPIHWTNIEIHTKIFHVLRTDLKICWFAFTHPGLQETCRSKIF